MHYSDDTKLRRIHKKQSQRHGAVSGNIILSQVGIYSILAANAISKSLPIKWNMSIDNELYVVSIERLLCTDNNVAINSRSCHLASSKLLKTNQIMQSIHEHLINNKKNVLHVINGDT